MPTLHRNMVIIAATLLLLLLTACSINAPGLMPVPRPFSPPEIIPKKERNDRAIITDRTGRQWDITHARDTYGMNQAYFNYGLGIGAIPSVDNPSVLAEGDQGYPEPDSSIQVFGVNYNGEQRAYSVSALTRHEVFNDTYPGKSNQYVSIAY